MGAAAPAATSTLVPWIQQGSLTLFGWMRWVVMCNLPLHFCENLESRRYTKLELIGQEQLRNGIQSVVRFIVGGVAAEMPAKFGLMLYGFSFDSEHYITVYGCYNFNGKAQYSLLAMAPLVADPSTDRSVASHVAFLREMLTRDYSKRLDDCLLVVRDNCATNQRMATLMGVPLVGCASHRLALAVQGRFSEASEDLDQVKKLMTKLKVLRVAGFSTVYQLYPLTG
ncbi:hypothetical protein PC119_g25614 [Phytophthora cactorum]|uniref:Uncharacterized protein n=1 Tax=Phytophthora cactorum TaxID=29920 RepID=A0A8T1ALX7_9STRA|nr:hypothetical protein PC117_g25837 [Phytophthora cactorum]KAG2963115.1 hypothetical protein PC119_g25614 [Phytophthora cactorum]